MNQIEKLKVIKTTEGAAGQQTMAIEKATRPCTPTDYETKMGLLEDVYTILDQEKILSGFEEQIGGFDLICKGNPVKPNFVSTYTNHLGCFNNRQV